MNTKDELSLNSRHLIGGQGASIPDAALEARHRERRVKTEVQFDQIRQVNLRNRAAWKTQNEAEDKRQSRA